jgi:hypothetical protein
LERAAEELSLDEPIDAHHQHEVGAESPAEALPPRVLPRQDLERLCANPLRDEPHPLQVGTVRRFGFVGLVACAIGAAVNRWIRSLKD